MVDIYDPYRWFWVHEDGRIYSSSAQDIVTDADAGYSAFILNSHPTLWPRDTNGNQTDAALTEVLAPYGLELPKSQQAKSTQK